MMMIHDSPRLIIEQVAAVILVAAVIAASVNCLHTSIEGALLGHVGGLLGHVGGRGASGSGARRMNISAVVAAIRLTVCALFMIGG